MPGAGRARPARVAGGRGARALFTALAAAGSLLPLSVLRGLSRRAAALAWRGSAAVQKGLDLNARRLLGPEATPAAREALARAQLRGFADFTAEIAASGRPGSRPQDLMAAVEGAENLEKALMEGRGVVAVTLHFGNYELLAAALAGRVPGGVAVVYNRDSSRLWERRRSRWRRRAGLDQIPIDGSPYFAVEGLARLRRGGAVLLSGDQVESRDGERIDLLGAAAAFSTLPARLSLASGAPLLPAFALRQPDGRYLLRLEPPIAPGKREARALTEELVAVYQRYLLRFPEEWLMVRPFWCADCGDHES
jgi:lauroyl/myristoyl acyltransferase